MIPKLHQNFIDNTIKTLKKDHRILGIATGGSYLTNNMDEFSDIDFVIVVKPEFIKQVMDERYSIAKNLGNLLSGFTGEHVGEPRLLICLYGPPLLHIDLKFVSLDDVAARVENPAILWEKDKLITEALKLKEPHFPIPDLQWLEDRFWVWVHYSATKIGRKEIFEAIGSINFIREKVIGPLLLMKNGKLPRGVRKIEVDAPEYVNLLAQTVPNYDINSCIDSLQVLIDLYLELREYHSTDKLIRHFDAEKYSRAFLEEITIKSNSF